MSKILEKGSLGGTRPTSSASPQESKRHEKTIPNYLRASTGSCHDFCKYGHKNPSEEEPSFSGGRRKKFSAHLNNLALHRSAILDRSKDVNNGTLSLAKSSISLGEAERVGPRIAPANRKGAVSNAHTVDRTATAAEHKTLNSDGRKKHSIVTQKVPITLSYSNRVPKIDKKETIPAKAVLSAKSKFPEKTSLEKSRDVDKFTKTNQSLHKRPVSSSSKLNMIKQVPIPSQASSHHLLPKDKRTPKGKVTSPAAPVTKVRAKPGQSPTRSTNSNINGKEGLDMSRSSIYLVPKRTASVEEQDDNMQITGYFVDPALEELSPDATECVESSQPAPEETENDWLGNTEKSEVLAGEALLENAITLELQQPLDGQSFNAVLGESDPKHKLEEQNISHGEASKDEDSQTDDATLCRLLEHVTAVENADEHESLLIDSVSKIEDDQVKVIPEGKEEVGVREDFERAPGLLILDEKHADESESCLDFTSGNVAENNKADEIFDGRMNNCASHCQSISETSSDGGLPEEPKSMLIEPTDSSVHEVPSISNENNFELDGLKSRVFIPQSPEELSDDEFYEEYDFELSESDESGVENEDRTINRNRDESLKSGDQRTRRISALDPGDANVTPYKLKFKRGKIVELPADSSGPRRLKFRRKSANEVLNRERQPTRRIYNRNNPSNVVPTNPDMESPGVKLRHQDAQEKKDAQGLFNNVIEETASKLVESRKSKVKALVGAFETVISLQDGKPTSSTPQPGSSQDLVLDDEGIAPEEAD